MMEKSELNFQDRTQICIRQEGRYLNDIIFLTLFKDVGFKHAIEVLLLHVRFFYK